MDQSVHQAVGDRFELISSRVEVRSIRGECANVGTLCVFIEIAENSVENRLKSIEIARERFSL